MKGLQRRTFGDSQTLVFLQPALTLTLNLWYGW